MSEMYIMLDNNNIIRDIIEFEHDGYQEIDVVLPLPIGINGGWFKYENSEIVEHPELKPKNQDEEIEDLKQTVADLTEFILFGDGE